MRTVFCAILAVAIVGAVGSQALGVVLFADNFDEDTVGAYPDSPQVGYWDTDAVYPAVVANLETPAAVSAPNLLNCPYGGTADAWGVSSRVSLPGETVHFEFQLHQDNVPHCSPHIGLRLPDTPVGIGFFAQAVALIGMNNTGTTQTVWYNDGTWHDSFVTYHPNIWEKFEMDYVCGESTYDLTVSSAQYGSESITLPVRTPGTVMGMATRSGDGWVGTYRFDDILLTGDAFQIPGDANNNGKVDAADAAILAANWQTMTGATWSMGDFNSDGAVDDSDATIMASNWSGGNAAGSSVPEPGTLVLLFGALAIGLVIRRK